MKSEKTKYYPLDDVQEIISEKAAKKNGGETDHLTRVFFAKRRNPVKKKEIKVKV